jgi:hypothetical protein
VIEALRNAGNVYLSVFELFRLIQKKGKQKPVNAIASVLVVVSFAEEVLH